MPNQRSQGSFRFPRALRLKRRRLIRPLFERERADVGRVAVGVVQLRYRVVPREATGAPMPFQVGFTPGRRTQTHVGRNRLRRVMREVWRLHQRPLLEGLDGRPDALTVFVVFRGREATAPGDLRRDLPEAMRRLMSRLARAGEASAPVEQRPSPSVPPAEGGA